MIDLDNLQSLGGWSGDPMDPDERDTELHETILSGDLGGGAAAETSSQ